MNILILGFRHSRQIFQEHVSVNVLPASDTTYRFHVVRQLKFVPKALIIRIRDSFDSAVLQF